MPSARHARAAFALSAASLLAGCQYGLGNYFEPVPGPGVASVRDHQEKRAARIRHNGLTVTIAGLWVEGSVWESFTLRYANAGPPVTVRPSLMRLRRPDGVRPATSAFVIPDDDPAKYRMLVDHSEAIVGDEMVVPTGGTATLTVSFYSSPQPGDRFRQTYDLKERDRVALLVPPGESGRTITLKARKPWLSFLF